MSYKMHIPLQMGVLDVLARNLKNYHTEGLFVRTRLKLCFKLVWIVILANEHIFIYT